MNKVKLGDVADIVTGPFGSMLHKDDYAETGTPVIMPQDIGDRTLSLASIAHVGSKDAERLARYATISGDIVYARRGDIEKHAFITEIEAGALCGTGCLRVRVDRQKADPLYISFALNGPFNRAWIRLHAVGSNMPNINTDILSSLPLELPSLEEQKSVAALLSAIDDKIALNKKTMVELEDTARLIYDYWFTQFDFPDENGRPYRSSGGKMVYNETLKREIPERWEAGLMSDLGSVVSGATPSTGDSSNYADEGIAWITPNDLSDNDSFMHISHGKRDVSGVGLASCSAVMMPAGSTIMSSRAPIGYLAVAETACCTNQGCKSLVADAGYPSYFNFFTVQRLMPLIRSQGAGTTFAEVSKEDFASVRLARPPKGMAERFEKSVLPLCEKSKRLQTETVELSSLRDWLLPMLMNGQVSISG